MSRQVQCSSCGHSHPEGSYLFGCPSCNGRKKSAEEKARSENRKRDAQNNAKGNKTRDCSDGPPAKPKVSAHGPGSIVLGVLFLMVVSAGFRSAVKGREKEVPAGSQPSQAATSTTLTESYPVVSVPSRSPSPQFVLSKARPPQQESSPAVTLPIRQDFSVIPTYEAPPQPPTSSSASTEPVDTTPKTPAEEFGYPDVYYDGVHYYDLKGRLRVWKNDAGTRRVQGSLIAYNDDGVVIRSKGRILRVPRAALGAEDQNYVRNRIEGGPFEFGGL